MKFIISKMNLDRNGYKIISYNASDNTKLSVSRGIGISMSALFVCALTVNILVLYIFKRTKTLQTRTNYWIMSVITCDLLTVINTFPFVIISSFAEEYIFGEIGCKWYGFMFTLLGTTSIFLLTGISVQRYLIICKNRNQTRIQKGKLVGPMFFCFLLGLLCAVFPLIGWGSYTIEGLNISCEPNWKSDNVSDKSYKLSLFVFALFVPGSILAFCYTRILYKVSWPISTE